METNPNTAPDLPLAASCWGGHPTAGSSHAGVPLPVLSRITLFFPSQSRGCGGFVVLRSEREPCGRAAAGVCLQAAALSATMPPVWKNNKSFVLPGAR